MTLKPSINIKSTIFDAEKDFSVTFSWTGNQSFKNRILVKLWSDESVVYDNTVETAQMTHLIPAGTLINGNTYTIQIQVYDVNDVESMLSDKIVTKCIKTPEFEFVNLSDGHLVQNSSYTFQVNYNQENGELLKEYQFYLYNSANILVNSSGLCYSSASTPSVQLMYTINGLENDNLYHIKCVGTTVNGFEIATKDINFHIKYILPTTFSILDATCDKKRGYIKYDVNIKAIEYTGDENIEIRNGAADLRDNEIYYDSAFNINGDFVLCIKVGKFSKDNVVNLLEVNNGLDSLTIDARTYGDDKRFKLVATNGMERYILYSDALHINGTSLVTLWVKRVDEYYDMIVFVDDGFYPVKRIYYCANISSVIEDESIWIYDEYGYEDAKVFIEEDLDIYEDRAEPVHSQLKDYDVWFEPINRRDTIIEDLN